MDYDDLDMVKTLACNPFVYMCLSSLLFDSSPFALKSLLNRCDLKGFLVFSNLC